MDINKLTIKSQQALNEAQSVAISLNHQEVDIEHLFKALLEQEEGITKSILEKLATSTTAFKQETEELLRKKPQVIGVYKKTPKFH